MKQVHVIESACSEELVVVALGTDPDNIETLRLERKEALELYHALQDALDEEINQSTGDVT